MHFFFTRNIYHSNAIEGNTLTYAETYAILYNDNSFKIEGKEPREMPPGSDLFGNWQMSKYVKTCDEKLLKTL